jgi:hypothetical protein
VPLFQGAERLDGGAEIAVEQRPGGRGDTAPSIGRGGIFMRGAEEWLCDAARMNSASVTPSSGAPLQGTPPPMKHSFNGYAYFANWSTNKLMPRPPRPVFDLVNASPCWPCLPGQVSPGAPGGNDFCLH